MLNSFSFVSDDEWGDEEEIDVDKKDDDDEDEKPDDDEVDMGDDDEDDT